MARATKAVAAAGLDRARIVMNLEARTIEIIIGEQTGESGSSETWTDDDV